MEFSWLNTFLVLLAAWASGSIVSRFGFPSVLGELGAGIIFGPPLLGILHGDAAITVLGRLGILMMILYIGTRIRPSELLKASGSALWPTIGGFFLPFVASYLVMTAFGFDLNVSLLTGTVVGTTALVTVSRVVVDLNLLSTHVGQTLTAIALFSIILVLLAFSSVMSIVRAGSVDLVQVGLVLGKAILFLVLIVIIGAYVFPLLGKLHGMTSPMPGRTSELTFAVLIATAVAVGAEAFGFSFILGSFLAGLFMRPDMFREGAFDGIMAGVRDVSLGFLAPIFYVSAGFRVSFATFQTSLGLVVTILVVSIITKFLGGFLFYLLVGRGWREAVVIGLGMNGRGSIDIIVASAGLEAGILSSEVFTSLIIMIFLATLTVPITLKLGAEWLRRRGELAGVDEPEKHVHPEPRPKGVAPGPPAPAAPPTRA